MAAVFACMTFSLSICICIISVTSQAIHEDCEDIFLVM
jgi:hypothetical protein